MSKNSGWGWRCIISGEIIDEVILENRRWAEVVWQSRVKREDVVREDIEADDSSAVDSILEGG